MILHGFGQDEMRGVGDEIFLLNSEIFVYSVVSLDVCLEARDEIFHTNEIFIINPV